jgi:hypothetical protein
MGKQGVKIAIIVVSLLSAGVIYYISTAPEAAEVSGEVTYTDILCQACNEHYQDTAEHLATIEIRSGVPMPAEGTGRVRRAARTRVTYPCSKCNETTAVAAFHCKEHDKYYPAEAADGGRGKCPDCFP